MSPRIEYESYDESDVLVDYIYSSQETLMTEDERLALDVFMVRLQAKGLSDVGNQQAADQLLADSGQLDNAAVNQLLEGGDFAFQQRVVDRVLHAEALGELVINRCPSCGKIVRSPLARQCLWCDHDWH